MQPKFRVWMVCVLLSVCGLSPSAQGAASSSAGTQADCLGRLGFPLSRPALPTGFMNQPCKPVLGGATTPQTPNDAPRRDDSGTYITFDVPGSSGTTVAGINLVGTIAGYYSDANGVSRGFLRRLNGTITTFDVPGNVNGLFPVAINDTGQMTGFYLDADFLDHGFLRGANGVITTFDVPGTVLLTVPLSINDAGVIAGLYYDENFVPHGFLRSRNGAITTFDVPGAVNGTIAVGIDLLGMTTGTYYKEDFVDHSFVRSRDGAITTFDVISGEPNNGNAINLLGMVTGQVREQHPEINQHLWRGYTRNLGGTIETFDAVPSPLDPCCTWTFPSSINLAGEVVGSDNDAHDLNHGFLRARDGAITILDAPGAGTGSNQGTFAVSINLFGVVAGNYSDANNVSHGFLWTRH